MPGMYGELEPLVFVCVGTPGGGIPRGGTARGGCWLPELTNPDTGTVGSESGTMEEGWWDSVAPGIAAPLKKICNTIKNTFFYYSLHVPT